MKKFLDSNFLLQNKTAEQLYHEYAKEMPIIDYHNHLPPDQVANNINFENLTQVWLYGDHYKWRAMRTNGVNEKFITGNASDWEKFDWVVNANGKISLKGNNGKYISSEGGQSVMKCNRETIAGWEAFALE